MANNFVPSFLCPVGVQLVLGQVPVTLNIRESEMDEEVVRAVVTHTGTGGKAARVANELDMKGRVTADLDADLAPWGVNLNLRSGQNCIIDAIYNGNVAQPWQIPAMIATVHYQMRIGAVIQYSFSWELNVLALAGGSGAITLPVQPDGRVR